MNNPAGIQGSPTTLDKAIAAAKLAVIQALLFSFFINILMLALPLYSLQVLDRVISSGSLETLFYLTFVILAALAALSVVQVIRSFMLIRLSNWFEQKLGLDLFAHSIYKSAKLSSSAGSQNLRDLGAIRGFVTGGAFSSLLDAPWAIIFIVILFFIHPWIGMLAIFGGGLLLAISVMNEYMTEPLVKEAGEYTVQSMVRAEAATRNSEAIEGMGMLSNVSRSWHALDMRGNRLQTTASNTSAALSGIAKFIRFALQIAVTGLGAYLVLDSNSMSVGGMIASSILVGRALAPFEASINSWKASISARAAYNRLKSSLQSVPARIESLHLPKPSGKIDVEDVYYVVPGTNVPIIRNLSFSLQPGEIIGVVGPSAAGKSTLMKLLLGIWQTTTGSVRLDGADVYSWNRDDFSHYVGYLPQQADLFDGTIKDNIARLVPGASDESIIHAAKMAHAHDMILHLAQGYETDIGPNGAILSAGQRQRIGLARAFYGDPKFVVLDEPNANLDQEGEEALLNTIKNAKKQGITTVIVSHRPAIMEAVDTMMVLKDGGILAYGARDDVLAKLRPQVPSNQEGA